MSILFPSDDWIKEAMVKINNSESYQNAAEAWEGDLVFVITAVPDERKEVHLYMDLWHGECRDAYEIKPGSQQPEFTITAPMPVWRKVLDGKLDPIRGLMSRQLKMKGNMMKVMKSPKAASELVKCCSEIDTAWPS